MRKRNDLIPLYEEIGHGQIRLAHLFDSETEYEVDRVVDWLFKSKRISQGISPGKARSRARGLAEMAGRSALQDALDAKADAQHVRAARRFSRDVTILKRSAQVIARAEITDVAPFFFFSSRSENGLPDYRGRHLTPGYRDLMNRLETFQATVNNLVSDIDTLNEAYPLSKGRGSPIHVLSFAFILHCAALWPWLTGAKLSRKRQADLIRYLAAAWTDLKFPEFRFKNSGPKSAEDAFRELVPKHPIFSRPDGKLSLKILNRFP